MTLEDETRIVNAVIWPGLFERQRRVVLSASVLAIHGKIQREGEVVHLVAQRLFDLNADLGKLGDQTKRSRSSMGVGMSLRMEMVRQTRESGRPRGLA